MHKIRLYVVPEVLEEEPVPAPSSASASVSVSSSGSIDEIDSPVELFPSLMQRRNSRRPSNSGYGGIGVSGGIVKLNVIQKDRMKADNSIVPKLKQIRQLQQQLQSKNNYNVDMKKIENRTGVILPMNFCSDKNNANKANQDINTRIDENLKFDDKKINDIQDIDGNDEGCCKTKTKSKIKSVFASPRIKELANNLEEKIIERNAASAASASAAASSIKLEMKSCENFFKPEENKDANFIINDSSVDVKLKLNLNLKLKFNNCNGADVTPRKMTRNESNNVVKSLSPIFESSPMITQTEIKNQRDIVIKDFQHSRDSENNNNNHNYNNFHNNEIINYRTGGGGGGAGVGAGCVLNRTIQQQNTTNNGNNNNSVILRKNNKLNRYREYDLEQKIEVEIKMREGSARLLAAARHRAQSLEAARALLTSNERMSAYMAELQRRKKETSSNKPSLPVSNARVSLSDLRIPLMWRDSDHFKNRGDYRRFAVFCLARVGTEIHDTALLCPVDRALTDVTFPDVLVFNNVPAEFELTLEIYSHILQEDLSIASTPRRIKRSIHSSISRTVGKKLAASLRDELNSGKIGPHFELMASARLTLDDTEDNIHTHDLVINNLENKNHSLPLFGHFCCRLAAQPECINKEACSGSIILDGRTCFARIQRFTLYSWDSRKLADEEQPPLSTVPINRETLIQPSKSSSKELRISNTIDGSDKITTIRLDNAEEAQKWVRQLVAHAKDHLRWRHAAETIQDVPSVESARNSFVSNKRQGSLYDETPLIESVQSDFNTASRPTVQEIFGLTPSTSLSSCSSSSSPPSLRSRSLSTSGTRKSGTNTLRSHWPFSNKNHD